MIILSLTTHYFLTLQLSDCVEIRAHYMRCELNSLLEARGAQLGIEIAARNFWLLLRRHFKFPIVRAQPMNLPGVVRVAGQFAQFFLGQKHGALHKVFGFCSLMI